MVLLNKKDEVKSGLDFVLYSDTCVADGTAKGYIFDWKGLNTSCLYSLAAYIGHGRRI